MKVINKFLIILIFVCLFFPSALADYLDFLGERVQLNGPLWTDTLAVARDKETCDKLIEISNYGNMELFDLFIEDYHLIAIENHTKALVWDLEILEGKAKVILLTGLDKGTFGWVPIEWLKGNRKALLRDYIGKEEL